MNIENAILQRRSIRQYEKGAMFRKMIYTAFCVLRCMRRAL